jgi:Ca2+-binding RTX toxin-like protein
MATRNVNALNNILDGTNENDTLIGDWRNNVIHGLDQDDLILGDGGDDTMSGDGGHDQLFGQSGVDRLFGGAGNDKLDGGADHDELHGGENNDELRGGSGDDELYGEGGNDKIFDFDGVDRIEGGGGNDSIEVTGGDLFRFDTVSGGDGNDGIAAMGSRMLVSLGIGNDSVVTDLHAEKVISGGAGNDTFIIDNLSTSDGRMLDIIGGDATVQRTQNIFGVQNVQSVTTGADTGIDTLDLSRIQGTSETFFDVPDVGTIDTLEVDLIAGRLIRNLGTNGYDTDGIVEVTGHRVARLVGIENVVGSNGGDGITGNFGSNNLQGRGGEDLIDGSNGNDTIDGGADNDVLTGGHGVDTVRGGAGNDVINGDDGQGIVFADTLTGGSGVDRFVFTDVGKGVNGVLPGTGPGVPLPIDPIRDRITDFDASGSDHDFIDLSALLDNRSSFTGTTVQQAFAQGFIFLENSSRGAIVKVDLNGGAHTDTANVFEVAQLEGVSAFSLTFVRNDLFLV